MTRCKVREQGGMGAEVGRYGRNGRLGSRSWGVQWRNGRYRSRGPTSSSPALMVLNNLLTYLQSKAKLCIIIFLKHLRPWVDFIFSKGFVPKSRFKQQNDFAIFFQPKENVTFYRLWDDTPVIFSNDEGQEISSGSSLALNLPCGREAPEGLHWKITATKRREK